MAKHCDMLATAICLEKYMKTHLSPSLRDQVEKEWLDRWKEKLDNPIRTPRQVLRSYVTDLGIIVSDLDAEVVGEALAKATFPVLLVWGSEDKTVAPEVGRQVKTLVPRSDLVELEGAAHTAYYERADTFNTIVTGYLEQPRQRHSVDGVRWN